LLIDERDDVVVSTRLPRSERKLIAELAALSGRSMAAELRAVLRTHLVRQTLIRPASRKTLT
jgi:hypothetical protein